MKPDPLPLQIEVHETKDYALIVPNGYLNALTGDQIDKLCESLIQKGIHYFVINFGKVEMINTIGISILVGIIEKVLTLQGLVYFTELGGTNREIFDVLNLSSVALIVATDEAAFEHMRHDRATTLRRAMGE